MTKLSVLMFLAGFLLGTSAPMLANEPEAVVQKKPEKKVKTNKADKNKKERGKKEAEKPKQPSEKLDY